MVLSSLDGRPWFPGFQTLLLRPDIGSAPSWCSRAEVCPYAARRAPPLVAGRPPLNPSHLLFIQRFTYALCNDGWIVVYRKRHGALKAVRARDEHAKPAFERVSGDLCFVR